MTGMTLDPELKEVAGRCLWWADANCALADLRQFLCHVMVYGLWQDAAVIRRRFASHELLDALRHAPAGLFDVRSWHYWHHVLRRPVPPRPSRQIPDFKPPTPSSKSEFHLPRI